MQGESEDTRGEDVTVNDGEEIETENGEPSVPAIDRLRERLESHLSGRSLVAYAVLAVGGLVLCILIAIIVSTTGGDEEAESAPCFQQPDVQAAKEAVLSGDVAKIRVILPAGEREFGVAFLELRMVDGGCFTLPQGQMGQDNAYLIIGAVDTYNRITDQRRIEVDWEEAIVPEAVFITPTATPTETPTATPTASPTATPEPTPTMTPTATAVPASPEASPLAEPSVVPNGTPDANMG
jgi:hypothetical protein